MDNPDWGNVKPIISEAIENGTPTTIRGSDGFIYNYNGVEIHVQGVYINGEFKISTAYPNTR